MKAEETLMKAEKTLNRLKDNFLSTVSHELLTPLTNMKMAIRMLKTASDTQARERYLEILETECVREIQMIDDLLRRMALS